MLGPTLVGNIMIMIRSHKGLPDSPRLYFIFHQCREFGFDPGWELRSHASWPKTQNPKQKQLCNKSTKDLKKKRSHDFGHKKLTFLGQGLSLKNVKESYKLGND